MKTFKSRIFLLASLGALTLSKKTIKVEQTPNLKATPEVGTYDTDVCLFNDGVNYACVQSTTNIFAGWTFQQKWQVATDMNPTAPTAMAATPAFPAYVQPDTILNVGYKYVLRLAPYVQAYFNVQPIVYIDQLAQWQGTFNIQ